MLVHALSDTGIGVEPILDPRIASLPLPEQEKAESNVIAVSPLFAAIHGLQHGDICHVRRIKHPSVVLDSVALLSLQPVDEYDQKELVDCLLSKAHLVSQNGLILVSHPKSTQLSSAMPTTTQQTSLTNGRKADSVSKSSTPDAAIPLSKQYLGFLVLDTNHVFQGVLTRKTTIYIVPPSPASSSLHSNGTFETRLHELYFTSYANGALAAKIVDANDEKIPLSASVGNMPGSSLSNSTHATTNTPTKPLMRSSMLVVPLGGGISLSPSPLASSALYSSQASTSPGGFLSPHTFSSFSLSRSQLRSPGTRGTTPTLSPSSSASLSGDSHRDVFNRSLLRVSILSRPFTKFTSRGRTTFPSSGRNSSNSELDSPKKSHPFDGDITLEIGVSLETMKQQMVGVFNASWVEVTVAPGGVPVFSLSYPQSNSRTSGEVRRQLARIFVMEGAEDFTLYLPPSLAFNLGVDANSNTTLAKVSPAPIVDQFVNDTTVISPLISSIAVLKFALVARPDNPHYDLSSKALVRYFSKPRILRQGEVFAVVVKKPKFVEDFSNPYLGAVSDSDDEDIDDSLDNRMDVDLDYYDANMYQVVHFKITSLEFSTPASSSPLNTTLPYFAYVPAHPNAISDGMVHSRVPPRNARFLLDRVHRSTSSLKPQSLLSSSFDSSVGTKSLLKPSVLDANVRSYTENSPAGLDEPFDELSAVIRPCLHPMSSSFDIFVSVLVSGGRGSGKTRLARQLSETFGISIIEVNCFDLIGHTDVDTEKKVSECFARAAACAPVLLLLYEFSAFDATKSEASSEPPIANVLKEQIANLTAIHKKTGYPVMVMATTINVSDLSRNLRSIFRVEVSIPSPDESRRLEMLKGVLEESIGSEEKEGVRFWTLHRDVKLRDLALKTASFQRKMLITLVTKAAEIAMKRVLNFQLDKVRRSKHHQSQSSSNSGKLSGANLSSEKMMWQQEEKRLEYDIACSGLVITSDDFDSALHTLHVSHSTSLGTPKIPQVKWEDVGGLFEAKREILDTIQLPLQHPEFFSSSHHGQRSGILLYGPPGTGKTLLAKAVATECSLNFISVKGPELINMYIGESEKNVREVFQRARDARPCVIFFDELDSLAPNRGRSGDSGGVMDRIVSQLLAELSDMSQKTDVFVIGATNRPDLIDPALLVPGRFDKLIFLGVNDQVSQKHNVLTALTRKFTLAPSCNLMEIAQRCPINLTGADLYALSSDAMALAIKSQIQTLNSLSQDKLDQLKREEANLPVRVEQQHFLTALEQLTPSVSMEELERYKEMATRFQKKT